ncbi:hypothetical protein C4573_01810 [Candidatus Woesearchaeota archaeon]|nr:MAG: hypothetical protein C4573_01810 [Candidatus Woesearchaeota archaeon]
MKFHFYLFFILIAISIFFIANDLTITGMVAGGEAQVSLVTAIGFFILLGSLFMVVFHKVNYLRK